MGDNNFTQQVVRKPSKATNEEEVSEADRAKHEAMAKEIEAKLQAIQAKPGEAFADFYARIKAEGAKLQTQYQPQLREGIVLTIELINSVKEDEKDGDVDVKVRIAPNATEEITSVKFLTDESSQKEGDKEVISEINNIVNRSYPSDGFANLSETETQNKFDEMYSSIKKEINSHIRYFSQEPLALFKGIEYSDTGQNLERIIYVRRRVEKNKPYLLGKVVVSFRDSNYVTRTLTETEGVKNPVYVNEKSKDELVKDRENQYIPREGYRYVNDEDVKNIERGQPIKSNGRVAKSEFEHMQSSEDSNRISTTIEGEQQIVGADGKTFNTAGRVDIDFAQIPREELSAVYTEQGMRAYLIANIPKENKGYIKDDRELQTFIDAIRTKEVVLGRQDKADNKIPLGAYKQETYIGKTKTDNKHPKKLEESKELKALKNKLLAKLKADRCLDPEYIISELKKNNLI